MLTVNLHQTVVGTSVSITVNGEGIEARLYVCHGIQQQRVNRIALTRLDEALYGYRWRIGVGSRKKLRKHQQNRCTCARGNDGLLPLRSRRAAWTRSTMSSIVSANPSTSTPNSICCVSSSIKPKSSNSSESMARPSSRRVAGAIALDVTPNSSISNLRTS